MKRFFRGAGATATQTVNTVKNPFVKKTEKQELANHINKRFRYIYEFLRWLDRHNLSIEPAHWKNGMERFIADVKLHGGNLHYQSPTEHEIEDNHAVLFDAGNPVRYAIDMKVANMDQNVALLNPADRFLPGNHWMREVGEMEESITDFGLLQLCLLVNECDYPENHPMIKFIYKQLVDEQGQLKTRENAARYQGSHEIDDAPHVITPNNYRKFINEVISVEAATETYAQTQAGGKKYKISQTGAYLTEVPMILDPKQPFSLGNLVVVNVISSYPYHGQTGTPSARSGPTGSESTKQKMGEKILNQYEKLIDGDIDLFVTSDFGCNHGHNPKSIATLYHDTIVARANEGIEHTCQTHFIIQSSPAILAEFRSTFYDIDALNRKVQAVEGGGHVENVLEIDSKPIGKLEATEIRILDGDLSRNLAPMNEDIKTNVLVLETDLGLLPNKHTPLFNKMIGKIGGKDLQKYLKDSYEEIGPVLDGMPQRVPAGDVILVDLHDANIFPDKGVDLPNVPFMNGRRVKVPGLHANGVSIDHYTHLLLVALPRTQSQEQQQSALAKAYTTCFDVIAQNQFNAVNFSLLGEHIQRDAAMQIAADKITFSLIQLGSQSALSHLNIVFNITSKKATTDEHVQLEEIIRDTYKANRFKAYKEKWITKYSRVSIDELLKEYQLTTIKKLTAKLEEANPARFNSKVQVLEEILLERGHEVRQRQGETYGQYAHSLIHGLFSSPNYNNGQSHFAPQSIYTDLHGASEAPPPAYQVNIP